MSNIEFLVAILISIWTSLSTTFSAFKKVNERRDVILTGKLENQNLTLEHRKLIWKQDWFLLRFGIIFRSFVFCVLMALIPFLINDKNNHLIIIIGLIGFLIPMMTLIGAITSYYAENKVLKKIFDDKNL